MELYEVFPGVYAIPTNQVSEEIWFIRDDLDEDGGDSLLHICERSEEAVYPEAIDLPEPCFLVKTGVVYWDYTYGRYRCGRCHEEWSTKDELACIWEDGIGTGHEGYA